MGDASCRGKFRNTKQVYLLPPFLTFACFQALRAIHTAPSFAANVSGTMLLSTTNIDQEIGEDARPLIAVSPTGPEPRVKQES